MNAIYGITVELDRTARASRVNRLRPGHSEPGQSRGRAASVKRSRPDNVKSSGYPQFPIWPCFVTILLGSTAFQGYFVACYWKSLKKLNLNACGNRTQKYDATQPIIRYWLNSGSNNFVSCLTEFWNLSFSELWILQSYWILLKTEFRLNSFKSELSQIWPNDLSCFTPKVDYPAPHWDIFITRPTAGGYFEPPLISETAGPILKIQKAFESPENTGEGKQIFMTSGSPVTSQVRSKSICLTFRAWWHRRVIFRC